jgi:signal transduction histidine kinase
LLLIHPYLLLRLVEHFRPVAAWVRWAALAGALLSALLVVVLPELSPPVTIVVVICFVAVEAYAAVSFVHGALSTGGLSNRRMWLAAGGSTMIATVILLAGVGVAIPAAQGYLELPSQIASILSALFYYFGFAPPRWLRRTWQLRELHAFLRASARRTAQERTSQALSFVCERASRAVGARATVAALWDETTHRLIAREATEPGLAFELSPDSGAVGRAWQTRKPAVARSPEAMAPATARITAKLEARSLLAAPIATADRRWGVLVAFLRHGPLFPGDDMELLELFGEQTALTLDQADLLATQDRLVTELRRRTAQLEAANRELEAFSYSVSHDLRAPLRHIQGFTDLLLRDGVTEAHRPQLLRITEASERMGRLIDDLLAFSRLNRQHMENRHVELSLLVELARRQLQHEIDGRQVAWKVGSLPTVRGDPDMLLLVFVNLMSNALKYTRPRAKAEIEIDCLVGAADEVVLYVRDNGVGFDMQYADKLFGVFQRLHHTTEFEGEGIGLANVRRIVQRHGGRTWAESTPEAGATFYFALPLASSPIGRGPATEQRENAGS